MGVPTVQALDNFQLDIQHTTRFITGRADGTISSERIDQTTDRIGQTIPTIPALIEAIGVGADVIDWTPSVSVPFEHRTQLYRYPPVTGDRILPKNPPFVDGATFDPGNWIAYGGEISNPLKTVATGNGVQAIFSFSDTPNGNEAITVFADGVLVPESDYTWTGGTDIVFSTPPTTASDGLVLLSTSVATAGQSQAAQSAIDAAQSAAEADASATAAADSSAAALASETAADASATAAADSAAEASAAVGGLDGLTGAYYNGGKLVNVVDGSGGFIDGAPVLFGGSLVSIAP